MNNPPLEKNRTEEPGIKPGTSWSIGYNVETESKERISPKYIWVKYNTPLSPFVAMAYAVRPFGAFRLEYTNAGTELFL